MKILATALALLISAPSFAATMTLGQSQYEVVSLKAANTDHAVAYLDIGSYEKFKNRECKHETAQMAYGHGMLPCHKRWELLKNQWVYANCPADKLTIEDRIYTISSTVIEINTGRSHEQLFPKNPEFNDKLNIFEIMCDVEFDQINAGD